MTEDAHTEPDEGTLQAEEHDAAAPHDADRPATAGEEAAAPAKANPDTAEHYQEMTHLGAQVEGEGKLP